MRCIKRFKTGHIRAKCPCKNSKRGDKSNSHNNGVCVIIGTCLSDSSVSNGLSDKDRNTWISSDPGPEIYK